MNELPYFIGSVMSVASLIKDAAPVVIDECIKCTECVECVECIECVARDVACDFI